MPNLAISSAKHPADIIKSMSSPAVWYRLNEETGDVAVDTNGIATNCQFLGTLTNLHSTPWWFSGTGSAATADNYMTLVGDAVLDEIFDIANLGNGLILVAYELNAPNPASAISQTSVAVSYGCQYPDALENMHCFTLGAHRVDAVNGVFRARLSSPNLSVFNYITPATVLSQGRHSIIMAIDGLNKTLRIWQDGTAGTPADATAVLAGWTDNTIARSGGFCLMCSVDMFDVPGSFMKSIYGMRNVFCTHFSVHPGETALTAFVSAHVACPGVLPQILTGL